MILLDVKMPVEDGFGCLAALKADPELRDIPVVMLTVMQSEELRGLTEGAADYVTKPIETHRLLEAVDRALDGAPSSTAL